MDLARLFRSRTLGRRLRLRHYPGTGPRARARGAERDQGQPLEIPQFQYRKQRDERAWQTYRQRHRGIGKFRAAVASEARPAMYVRRPFTSRPAVFLHSDSTFFRHKAAEQGKAHTASARRNRRSRTGRERRLIAGWLVGYTAASGRWHFASERTFAHG